MKFVLMGDWPCNGGALTVPAGTVIEWDPDPERARLALATMDRMMDAQDAIDRAERTRHFNRLPLDGGE